MVPWLSKKSEDQSGGPRTNLEVFGDEVIAICIAISKLAVLLIAISIAQLSQLWCAFVGSPRDTQGTPSDPYDPN